MGEFAKDVVCIKVSALRAVVLSGALLGAPAAARADETRAATESVTAEEREVVVLSELRTHAPPQYDWLYSFLEASGVSIAVDTLSGSYRNVHVLAGEDATLDGFAGVLSHLAADGATRAVDVVVNLHGFPEGLAFREGSYDANAIVGRTTQAFATAGTASRAKLRALYSTACYGAQHMAPWLAAGFRVVNGAARVNTSAAYEYSVLLGAWRDGASFADATAAGDQPFFRALSDSIASSQGFGDADSTKSVSGHGWLRIDDDPRLADGQ